MGGYSDARFSVLQGTRPRRELYVSSIPEYVDVSYDLLLWAEYTEPRC